MKIQFSVLLMFRLDISLCDPTMREVVPPAPTTGQDPAAVGCHCMARFIIIGSILAGGLFWPSTAKACDCVSLRTCEVFWEAAAVFVGRVVSADWPTVTLQVVERLRGQISGPRAIVTGPRSNCAYPFVVGETYLVFAYETEPGLLEVSLCSGTQRLSSAREDLAYARSTRSVNRSTRGRVTGAVELLGADGTEQPLPARTTVTAALARGRRFTTSVNPKGQFRFENLPLGAYVLTASAPGGYVSDSDEVAVNDASGCGSPFIYLQFGTAVTGRVLDSSGRVLAGVPLVLALLNDIDSAIGVARRQHARSNLEGKFSFERAAPAQWSVSLDSTGLFDVLPILPRAFFPGVVDVSNASLLSVPSNGRLELSDFVIPSGIDLVALHGTAVYADGQPAANAEVSVVANRQLLGHPVQTDADGRFVVAGRLGATYALSVKKSLPEGQNTKEVWSRLMDVTLTADMAPLRVELEKQRE